MNRSGEPLAFMLEGSRGRLCALYFAPHGDAAARGDLLVVPPFAEEMNRCRAMVALQARSLALQGVGTLVLDPYGTGDSEGEFADATWAQWFDDLLRGVRWLDTHGQGCRALLALRLGAVMASQLLRACPGIDQLLLWQPVLSGKTFYTQFLRIRIAAEMNLPDGIKTTNALRQMSAAGQLVEVSGYEIGPGLAAELDAVAFDTQGWPAQTACAWWDVQADGSDTLLPASVKAIESLQAAGRRVKAAAVAGPAFWHVHERELAPALVDATAQAVRVWPNRPAKARQAMPATPSAGNEFPLILPLGTERLSAFVHRGARGATRGVVIVVAGGPQYRAGAHRQFVSLARKLSAGGHPVLRFDLQGMGDSTGEYVGFQQSAGDIRAAIDSLMQHEPGLSEVVLIGECESASGILFYAWQDARVTDAVLINPWVRTAEGQAQVILKSYYRDRLRSPEFWRKVRGGNFNIVESLRSLVNVVRAYVRGKRMFAQASLAQAQDDMAALPLPEKTASGLSRFQGRVLLLMSGHDYIAREFDEVTGACRAWDGLLGSPRLVRKDIAGADHTFSKRVWKDAASNAIVDWVAGG